MLSSSDQSHGPWRGAKPCYNHVGNSMCCWLAPGPFFFCVMLWNLVWSWPDLYTNVNRGLTCVCGCSNPACQRSAAPSAAGGCWSTGQGLWRWWPCGWSPAPARTRWNSGWRKYCALPAMRNKEINKKAKAPLMRRSAQLDYNRLKSQQPSQVETLPADPGCCRRLSHLNWMIISVNQYV